LSPTWLVRVAHHPTGEGATPASGDSYAWQTASRAGILPEIAVRNRRHVGNGGTRAIARSTLQHRNHSMDTTNGSLNRKLRMALVGGGQGAFIGRVHATAAVLDNRAALVAGCLSSNAEKAKASAPDYAISPERAYGSVDELIASELKMPPDRRIDFVSVATPNHTHFAIAKAAVEAGFNVICDKPMTFDLQQAEELAEAVEKSGVVFAVSH